MEVGRAVFFKTSFLFPSPSSEGEIGGKRSRKVFPLPPPSLICVASPEGGGSCKNNTGSTEEEAGTEEGPKEKSSNTAEENRCRKEQ